MKTIFDDIVSGEMRSWKVWESDTHLAFLTPFPNTIGHTVVIPKENPGDNVFEINQSDYIALFEAVREVATTLKRSFGIDRVGMAVDGTGVAHAHVQLIPQHEDYPGYITSKDGEKTDEAKLDEIQAKILGVQK